MDDVVVEPLLYMVDKRGNTTGYCDGIVCLTDRVYLYVVGLLAVGYFKEDNEYVKDQHVRDKRWQEWAENG